jgi:hypothetical protein
MVVIHVSHWLMLRRYWTARRFQSIDLFLIKISLPGKCSFSWNRRSIWNLILNITEVCIMQCGTCISHKITVDISQVGPTSQEKLHLWDSRPLGVKGVNLNCNSSGKPRHCQIIRQIGVIFLKCSYGADSLKPWFFNGGHRVLKICSKHTDSCLHTRFY